MFRLIFDRLAAVLACAPGHRWLWCTVLALTAPVAASRGSPASVLPASTDIVLAAASTAAATAYTLPPATTGVPYAFQVTTVPAPGAGAVYAATGLPAGLSIDLSSGLISGTPTSAGSYSVTLTITAGTAMDVYSLTLVVTTPTWVINPTGSPIGTNWTVSNNQFLAARLTVTAPARIAGVQAKFAHGSGTLFAAIVPLTGNMALPAGAPFTSTEVVASTTFTLPASLASPVVVPLNFDAPAGVYGVIFGTGRFGATGAGSMPANTVASGSSSFSWVVPPLNPATWQNLSSGHFAIGLATVPATAPTIASLSAPRQIVAAGQSLTLGVVSPEAANYQWKRNGRSLPGATNATYTITAASATRDAGWYQVVAGNAAGTTTSAVIFVNVAGDVVVAWGDNGQGQTNVPMALSGVTAVAAGTQHSLALRSDGTVVAWGANNFGQASVPALLDNVVAIAAANSGSIALKADGTLVSWGNVAVPANVTNAVAIAADSHTLVVRADGTVVAAGNNDFGQANVPAALSGVVGVAANGNGSLALKADGTVVAWGSNLYGQATVPAGLANVVAVANADRGYALKADGTVTIWGAGLNVGQSRMPNGLPFVAAIAASSVSSAALYTDGTVATWGVTSPPSGLAQVIALAEGYYHVLAIRQLPPQSPIVVTPPAGVLAMAGTGASFRVNIVGVPVPTLHWQRQASGTTGFVDLADDSTYAGTTTTTLTISVPTLAMSGDQFRCVGTNNNGSVTSQAATLTVVNGPSILTQPVTQSVTSGQSATFTVVATAGNVVTYQWRRNGVPIAGATFPLYQVAAATRADADFYDVVVTAEGVSRTSTPVRLIVAPTSYPGNLGLDPAFNVTVEAGPGTVRAIVPLSDGRFYIAGNFLRVNGHPTSGVARFNADRTVDTTFAAPRFDQEVAALAVQSDGRILAGGIFTRVGEQTKMLIARLNPDGTLDNGFAFDPLEPGGVGFGFIRCLVVQPDGRIVVGRDGGIGRLNAGGSRDTSFNASVTYGGVMAIQRLPDGKLLTGGYFSAVNGTARANLARLYPDGSLDGTFTAEADGQVNALALAADGKVIVGGNFSTLAGAPAARYGRLSATGAFDASFTGSAAFTNGMVQTVAVDSAGRILVGGTGLSGALALRLTSAGGNDVAVDGLTATGYPAVYAVAPLSDGSFLAGGEFGHYNGQAAEALMRGGAGGSPQPLLTALNRRGVVFALLPEANGSVVVAGDFRSVNAVPRPHLARILGDGTVDPASFTGSGPNDIVRQLLRTADGKLLARGRFYSVNGIGRAGVARLEMSGAVDPGFDPGNVETYRLEAMAVAPGNRVLVSGWFTQFNGVNRNEIVRLNADGSVDPTFNLGAGTDEGGYVLGMAMQPDGRIGIVGGFTTIQGVSRNRIARILADGALDPSFDVGSGFDAGLSYNSNVISHIHLTAANQLAVTGYFSNYHGTAVRNVVRLGSTGARDTAFAPPENLLTNSVIDSLTLEDNRVLVWQNGEYAGWSSTQARIMRLTPSGVVDSTFQIAGIRPIDNVTAVAMRDDGQLFVALSTTGGVYRTAAITAPTIAVGLPAQVTTVGTTVTFTANVTAVPAATYQWFKDGVALAGATNATLVIPNAPASSTGGYTFTATNLAGTATSNIGTLAFAPDITGLPLSRSVGVGGLTRFTVLVSGTAPFSYQWKKDGVAIAGATDAAYAIAQVTSAHAGSYGAEVSNAYGTVNVPAAALTVLPNPLAYAGRQFVGPSGGQAYFAITGSSAKRVLLRALGPTLGSLGVSGALADPTITVFDAAGHTMAANDNWGDLIGTDRAALFARLGALPLAAGSKDAMLDLTLPAGGYAVRIAGVGGRTGVVLLEMFDADLNPIGQLRYVAFRDYVAAGKTTLAGLTMTNSAAKRVLLRAIGPTLGAGGVSGATLLTYDGVASPAQNAGWVASSALAAATAEATAFALPADSHDAVVLVDTRIGTGAYTAQINGSGNGQTLLEFYDATGGTVDMPLLVVAPPTSQTVTAGANVTLQALAIGAGPLTYQWRKDGTALAGATLASLTLPAVAATDAGSYDVAVQNATSQAASSPATLTVLPTGLAATQTYTRGTTAVTVTSTLSYAGTATSLGWSVSLPAGWSFASDGGSAGEVKPAVGATDTLEWAWTTVPASPVTFTYTVNVPAGQSGLQLLTANAIVRAGQTYTFPATPEPLLVAPLLTHDADTDRNYRINLLELTRVIELYNTRSGTTRTGCYRVQDGTEDGFATEPTRANTVTAVLTRFHSADTNRDGRLSLLELTRVIELYNYRSGTTRTGQYHVPAPGVPLSEDGFVVGP